MTKYSRIGREEKPAAKTDVDQYGQDVPPDPAKIIMCGLYEWQAQCRRPLPQPCPANFEDCIAWWREQMQEPERRGETTIRKGGHGSQESPNWDCSYAVRVRSSLLRFLALNDEERNFVVAARQDGIFYNGENMEHFVDVIEETSRLQEMGVGAYQKAAIAAMKGAVMSMLGQPTSPSKEPLTERYRPPEGSAEWYEARPTPNVNWTAGGTA